MYSFDEVYKIYDQIKGKNFTIIIDGVHYNRLLAAMLIQKELGLLVLREGTRYPLYFNGFKELKLEFLSCEHYVVLNKIMDRDKLIGYEFIGKV